MKQFNVNPLLLSGMALLAFFSVRGQVAFTDSVETLETVEVKAYESKRLLTEAAFPIVVVNKKELYRFGNNNFVPVMNSQPGIRMEERSPGSYRLNIRGSSLRAPFGVRNVKIYYNGIPYTTPGGDSYFNQLSFHTVTSMEIIKGPGSSIYGAGTGGVVLLQSDPANWKQGGFAEISGGSFGMRNSTVHVRSGTEHFRNAFTIQQQRSDGYRNHTEMERTVFQWDLSARTGEKSRLMAHFLYGNLQYQTPGGLNQKEFDSIPRSARPRVGSLPGAIEAKASIDQKTFLSGFRYQFRINEHWSDETSLYGAFTRLRNPGIFNFSWGNEAHTGGRTLMTYKKEAFTFITGMEMQQGFTTAKAFKNVNGLPDSLRTDDEVNHFLLIGFAQASLKLKGDWIFDGGISINKLSSTITRLSIVPVIPTKRSYSNQWAPRLAVLKKINKRISLFASIARGFSPPTTSELLPSSGIVATELTAESGINLEIGSRGMLYSNRLSYDISFFRFQLKDAIVVRRDAVGRDYFINAGSTKQEGVELRVNYRIGSNQLFLPGSRIWFGYTGYAFVYDDFKRGTVDFSGKQLPSVPKHTVLSGLDLLIRGGWYGNLTHTYTGQIPLNDANTDWSVPYHYFALRAGWKKQIGKKIQADLYFTGDNLTDVRYSLGFDLNANAGRYFNTAPGRNWAIGMMLNFGQ